MIYIMIIIIGFYEIEIIDKNIETTKRLLSKVEIDSSKEWFKKQLIELYIQKAKSIVNKFIKLEKI